MCRNTDLTRWTSFNAGPSAVHEQMHSIDHMLTQTNGPVDIGYDQILALIDSYLEV